MPGTVRTTVRDDPGSILSSPGGQNQLELLLRASASWFCSGTMSTRGTAVSHSGKTMVASGSGMAIVRRAGYR
eukprot:3758643-Alexandrium_andersonii.AAC.1